MVASSSSRSCCSISDGGFLAADGTAVAGMVLRRYNGSVVFAAYRFLFDYNDALEAEIHALMQGMALAIQHSEIPVIVQSDSSEALAALSGEGLSRSTYGHLVAEIKLLMSQREFIPTKLQCKQNRAADRLASYSRTEQITAVWLQVGPPCIEEFLPLGCKPITME